LHDVIVVGAGPAGGQCARTLTSLGYDVVTLERLPSLDHNPFSTAGAPIEIMDDFDLPWDIVGAKWSTLRFVTDSQERAWHSDEVGGVVFDFAALRHFLTGCGGDLRLGTPYKSHQTTPDGVVVNDRFAARLLVDATGSERRVLGAPRASTIEATGIEQLVEVSPDVYARWANALNLFMGRSIPGGYGWIFPMQEPLLKVGIGRYFPKERNGSYREQLGAFLHDYVGSWTTKEQHGKSLSYAKGRSDLRVDGRVITLGESANPLAFEGIRHAMWSGQIAAECIDRHLRGERRALRKLKSRIRKYCGPTWRLTEWATRAVYHSQKVDQLLEALDPLSYKELYSLCFDYKLRPTLKLCYNAWHGKS